MNISSRKDLLKVIWQNEERYYKKDTIWKFSFYSKEKLKEEVDNLYKRQILKNTITNE